MPLNKWLCGPLGKHLEKVIDPFLVLQQINPALRKIVSSGILRELPHAELDWTLISIFVAKASRFRIIEKATIRVNMDRKTTTFNQRPARITCRFSERFK